MLVFPPAEDSGVYTVLPFFWLPEDTLPLRVRRDHVMYDVWQKQGFIQTTEGNVVHYGFIEQFICQLGERYNIREIAYDRWNATMMVQALEDDGFTMIPFGQGFKDMSPPTKELMRLVLERHVNHGGIRCCAGTWTTPSCARTQRGISRSTRRRSTEKVDGAVALVMALDRAMKNQGGGSVYDEPRAAVYLSFFYINWRFDSMPKSPSAPAGIRVVPTCAESGTYCPEHSAESPDRMRGSAAERGYGADWRKARKQFLARNPLCNACMKQGVLTPATIVDHITPHRGDPQLFWGRNKLAAPLQALHDKKTGSGW